ncbi:MAG: hypothetical protein HY675_13880 [Chloroflexi bacterium]|nr:hypothetical protein [Chloroflexota bacterium]
MNAKRALAIALSAVSILGLLLLPGSVLTPMVAEALPGGLDITFGRNGLIQETFGGSDQANAVAIQSDGKIVVAGSSVNNGERFALARYESRGFLDFFSFGTGGKVVTDFPGFPDVVASDVAIQPDAKIVVVGTANANSSLADFALARYNSNGTLDTTFGTCLLPGACTGTQLTDFGIIRAPADVARAVALQPDGKIVVAGGNVEDVELARYTRDGNLDPTFGQGGKAIVNFRLGFEEAVDVVLQGDGKIVTAVRLQQFIPGQRLDHDFAVARFEADGRPDTTFGTGGITWFRTASDEEARSVALQLDGKIVAAGRTTSTRTRPDFVVARFDTNGLLDTTFGAGTGVVTTDFGGPDEATGVAVVAFPVFPGPRIGQKIVVVGWSRIDLTAFAVARYNLDGTLDADFGLGGKTTNAWIGGADLAAHAVAVGPPNRSIVLVGVSATIPVAPGSSVNQDFAVARFLWQ